MTIDSALALSKIKVDCKIRNRKRVLPGRSVRKKTVSISLMVTSAILTLQYKGLAANLVQCLTVRISDQNNNFTNTFRKGTGCIVTSVSERA